MNKRAKVIPDQTYPDMWRVQWPDGRISDMVNLTRANDAVREYERAAARKNADARYKLKASQKG